VPGYYSTLLIVEAVADLAQERRLYALRMAPSMPTPRVLAATAAFAAALGVVVYRAIALSAPAGVADWNLWALIDFRDAIYYPVRAFLAGDNPYATAAYMAKYPALQVFPPYSPLTLVVHAPFGLLPVKAAEAAYFATTVGLTLLLAAMVLRMSELPRRIATVATVAAIVLASRPGHWNLLIGQSTLQLVLGTYLALYLGRTRPWLAGLGLAITTIKPTYGAPVALFMLAAGQYRSVAWGTAIAAVPTLAATVVLATNAGGLAPFVASLHSSYVGFAADPSIDAVGSPARIDALALVARVIGATPPTYVDLALTAILLAAAVWAIRRVLRTEPGDDGARLVLAIGCMATLTAGYQLSYNALLAAAPLAFVLTGRWAPASVAPRHWKSRWLLVALLAIPALNYFASFGALSRFDPPPTLWWIAVTANSAALTAAFIIYVRVAAYLPEPGPPRYQKLVRPA
jgi:hypothetical protein